MCKSCYTNLILNQKSKVNSNWTGPENTRVAQTTNDLQVYKSNPLEDKERAGTVTQVKYGVTKNLKIK